MKRVKGVTITPYYGAIQDKGEDYYMQFNIVICGLDSVEARRWINATLVDMVDMENPDSLKPLIDGGTEGTMIPGGGWRLRGLIWDRVQGPVEGDFADDYELL